MKKILRNGSMILLYLCILATVSVAQSLDSDQGPKCGFDGFHKEQMKANPEYKNILDDFEMQWKENQMKRQGTANRIIISGTDTVYEIPLVFHIIHTGQPIGSNYNPSNSHINDVVDYLNQTYAASWTGYPLANQEGVNVPIRFVLAKRNPSCETTDGINRINANDVLSTSRAAEYAQYGVKRASNSPGGIEDLELKSLIQWDPSLYYNVWVVSKIDGWDGYVSGGGVVGYAAFPGNNPIYDGTVIMERFNAPGQTTLPHEIGHAMSLYHTFQDSCAVGNCLVIGDRVCDTDPHYLTSGCPTGNNPCTGTSWVPVVNNFMNYTNCTDRFTEGQKERMKLALITQRSSLISSLGGTAPGQEVVYDLPVALNCSIPTLPPGSQNNLYNMGPANIKIGGLEYYSGGYSADGYQEYIDHTQASCLKEQMKPIQMNKGETYPVDILTLLNPQNVRVWIDFNNDGSFELSELIFTSNGSSGEGMKHHIGNTISIPTTAVTSVNLRMRVLADFIGAANFDACGDSLLYGQIEDFFVTISDPLPVNLKDIIAIPAADQKSINVIWNTASERDVAYYEIQKSLDGKSFEKIGELRAKNEPSKYVFSDENPVFNQQNYYRLRMVDRDESSAFSKVVSASIDRIVAAGMEAYPNPANDFINVVLNESGSYHLTITNTLGQLIYSNHDLNFEKSIPQVIDLKSNKLTPGLYYLNLKDQSGKNLKSKFVIGKF